MQSHSKFGSKCSWGQKNMMKLWLEEEQYVQVSDPMVFVGDNQQKNVFI